MSGGVGARKVTSRRIFSASFTALPMKSFMHLARVLAGDVGRLGW